MEIGNGSENSPIEASRDAGRAGQVTPTLSMPVPVPVLYDWNREFFRGGTHGKLMLQCCGRCHQLIYYPRILCPYCLSEAYDWVAMSGRGTIYSYSVVWRPLDPAFESRVPIVLAMVDLEEHVQMVSSLVGCSPSLAVIGMPVTVVFETIAPGVAIPKFVPVDQVVVAPPLTPGEGGQVLP